MARTIDKLILMPSYEERSTASLKSDILNNLQILSVTAIRFSDLPTEVNLTISQTSALNALEIETLDRLSTRSMWDWAWKTIGNLTGKIIVDATCFNRELLGMILFALSIRRNYLDSIEIAYTSPGKYITQRDDLDLTDKWLSRGISSIRSIVGFPGNFTSDKERHLIALAGHEEDRLFEVIEYFEPMYLSISNESPDESTVIDANQISYDVEQHLRQKIAIPEIDTISFSAKSIQDTFDSLAEKCFKSIGQNIGLVAMNTKLSFIGAALYALHDRSIRMIYAVPEEYNPNYSVGVGETTIFDITQLIKEANTQIP